MKLKDRARLFTFLVEKPYRREPRINKGTGRSEEEPSW